MLTYLKFGDRKKATLGIKRNNEEICLSEYHLDMRGQTFGVANERQKRQRKESIEIFFQKVKDKTEKLFQSSQTNNIVIIPESWKSLINNFNFNIDEEHDLVYV